MPEHPSDTAITRHPDVESNRCAAVPAPAGSVPVHWNAQESLRTLMEAAEALAVTCRRWEAARTTGHEYDVLDALREYEVAKEKWDHPVKVVHLRPGADGFLQQSIRRVADEFTAQIKRQSFRVDV